MTRLLAELSGPAAAAALSEDSILVLPVGSVEHHGSHLPLITDTLIAEATVTAAVARAADAGMDAWQLPTLSIAKSDEHSWAPGTLWLTAETFLATLVDIGRSVAGTPARTILFVNGHGGNMPTISIALRELRRRYGLRTFAMAAGNVPSGDGTGDAPDELGMGVHAGYTETSLMLHLRPDLVDESAFARHVPEHLADLKVIGFSGKPVSFGWLSDDFDPAGVIGDPTGSNAAAGKRFFEDGVALTVSALEEISRFRSV